MAKSAPLFSEVLLLRWPVGRSPCVWDWRLHVCLFRTCLTQSPAGVFSSGPDGWSFLTGCPSRISLPDSAPNCLAQRPSPRTTAEGGVQWTSHPFPLRFSHYKSNKCASVIIDRRHWLACTVTDKVPPSFPAVRTRVWRGGGGGVKSWRGQEGVRTVSQRVAQQNRSAPEIVVPLIHISALLILGEMFPHPHQYSTTSSCLK